MSETTTQPKEKVTVDSIIGTMQEWVENKSPIDPATWVDAAAKLNVLLGAESDELFLLQQQVAQNKLEFLNELAATTGKKNVSEAQLKVETSDQYRQMKSQEAKIKRVEEFIRIAKLQGRLGDSQMKGY